MSRAIVLIALLVGGCTYERSERSTFADPAPVTAKTPKCLQPPAAVEIIGADRVSQEWIDQTIAANVIACGYPRPEPRGPLRRTFVVVPLK